MRSGAAVSMPGMMDTVLDVGLNPATRAALARRMSRPRSALDSHRRFIEMYAEVALDVDPELLAEVRDDHLEALGLRDVAQLDEAGLLGLVQAWERRLAEAGRTPDPRPAPRGHRGRAALVEQPPGGAVPARHGIPDEPGTAVTVQCMVFGNLGQDSATGVAFTRDPSTGEPSLFGEFLPDAQGEDVVSGAYTPSSLRARGPPARRLRRDRADRPHPGGGAGGGAGSRVHRGAGAGVDAPDPRGPAVGAGRGPHGRRDGRGRAHHPGPGPGAGEPGAAHPPAAPQRRRGRSSARRGAGPAGQPGRRDRARGLRSRRGGGAGGGGRGGHPGPGRDVHR
ncbi:MAG: PEP/pyruvate-binding domain-containing protein [bacterium]